MNNSDLNNNESKNMMSPVCGNRTYSDLTQTCYQPKNERPKRIPGNEVNFNTFFKYGGSNKTFNSTSASAYITSIKENIGNQSNDISTKNELPNMDMNTILNFKNPNDILTNKDKKIDIESVSSIRKESLPEIISEKPKLDIGENFKNGNKTKKMEEEKNTPILEPILLKESASQVPISEPKVLLNKEVKRATYSEILQNEVKKSMTSNKRKRNTNSNNASVEYENNKRRITSEEQSTKETISAENDLNEFEKAIHDITEKITMANNLLNDTKTMISSIQIISKTKEKRRSSIKRRSGSVAPLSSFFTLIQKIFIPPVITFHIDHDQSLGEDNEERYIYTIGSAEISIISIKHRTQI